MRRHRRWGLAVCAALIGAVLAAPSSGSASTPRLKLSPPGQIQIVTVNAEQMMKASPDTSARLDHLIHALATRPSAFDGGFVGAVFAPDVIVTQEMKASVLQRFADRLSTRVGDKYQVVGLTANAAQFLFDTETIAANGPVIESPDSCDGALGGKRVSTRFYDIGQFTEKATDTNFVVAGVHLSHQYDRTEQPLCYERNILQLRTELETLSPPIFIAGDFNKRAVREKHECDPEERSAPSDWWLAMTAPSAGRPYVDTVQSFVKTRGGSMAGEWTERQLGTSRLCDGTKGRHRGRIDYIFESGSVVAQAHVDKFPQRPRVAYSDHRFVWGRFVIAGPPTPSAPTATAEAGGVIDVEWKPDPSAQQWLVYRALGDHPYKLLDRLPPGTTSIADSATEDGELYRYSVAAVGTGGGQSAESPPAKARADASGPDVVSAFPYPRQREVAVDQRIEVSLSERPASTSVTPSTIRVINVTTGHDVAGSFTQTSPRHLSWAPASGSLRKATTYRFLVSGLRDGLGNPGIRYASRFHTVKPPKRHHKHHHHHKTS